MRVLLISHTCQSLTEGLPKAHFLGQNSDIELCVLVPHRWKHYGQWRSADRPEQPTYKHHIGRVAWPWTGPGQFYLHWYPTLPLLLRRFRPDIIDLWEEPWSLASAQTCWLRPRLAPQAKIITETEQNIFKVLPSPFESFRRFTLQNADFAVARNAEGLANLRRQNYAGPGRVVPNAVDADLFRPESAAQRAKTRGKLNLQGFVAGYVGRLVEEKGLMDMVEALALLPSEVSLLFVGSGPFQEDLEKRALSLQVSQRVRFLGARALTDLPPLMNALSALVLPSRTTPSWKEQFGRVLIEAAACGVPVVGSSSGAIPEVIGAAGLVFPEGDVPALAQALSRLQNHPEEAARFGVQGRQRVEENFTWQGVARQMAEIYREVLQ